jgi:ABC-type multidrug transport system ATPase subunit
MALPAGLALVLGDESSGKTTLLRLLAGVLRAQTGTLRLNGVDLGGARSATTSTTMAQVFWADPRDATFDDTRTARQWLDSLPALYPGWDAAALAAHVQGFSLDPHIDKPFFALSTGSKRKVFMAGALASGAALTLIDEPVAGLDKPSITYLAQAFNAVADQPGRVLVVAHYETLAGVHWGQVLQLPGR